MAEHAKASFLEILKDPWCPPHFISESSYMGPSYKCPNCTGILKVDLFTDEPVTHLFTFRFKCGVCKWNGMMFMTRSATNSRDLVRREINRYLSIDILEQTERELEGELKNVFSCSN